MLGEWECSALVADNSALSALAFDFFFAYFNYFDMATYQAPWLSATVHNVFAYDSFGLFFQKYEFFWFLYLALQEWKGLVLTAHMALLSALNLNFFSGLAMYNYIFFCGTVLADLYLDFTAQIMANFSLSIKKSAVPALISTQSPWLLEFVYSCDWVLLGLELTLACVVLNYAVRLTNFYPSIRVFYDDIITFCKTNNLSVTELGIFFTFCLGFVIFDIFSSAIEEDVTDVFFYFMLCFVLVLFVFLIGGIDVQYFYMISSTSAGDLTTRVVVFDVINNFLCVLRIFFCWVRYIFYDLQVELIDFAFHYTDAINDLNAMTMFENFVITDWGQSSYTLQNNFTMISSLKVTFWLLVYFFIDVAFIIFQILLSFAKLFIAFFLLWLIVDLFILKALALAESMNLSYLRSRLAKQLASLEQN